VSPGRKPGLENNIDTEENAMGLRIPEINTLIPEVGQVTGALLKAAGNGSVPSTTISLIYLRAGQIIGSTYQTIRHTMDLRKAGESEERIATVATWWDAPYFIAAERAALRLTEAVFQPNAQAAERVPDDLFAEVAKHYDDKALATLTVVVASAGFWMNVALVLQPSPAGQEAEQA
jgi:alkylhydroperoxidase family enzyme